MPRGVCCNEDIIYINKGLGIVSGFRCNAVLAIVLHSELLLQHCIFCHNLTKSQVPAGLFLHREEKEEG
jgi:hypothetical protein